MRTFHKNDFGECIGAGSFGSVYVLDEFRVIKVIQRQDWLIKSRMKTMFQIEEDMIDSALREIEGVGHFLYSCPILEVVWVDMEEKGLRIGLIKPYIQSNLPYASSSDFLSDFFYMLDETTIDYTDFKEPNYVVDNTGRPWRIDTDHRGCLLDATPKEKW